MPCAASICAALFRRSRRFFLSFLSPNGDVSFIYLFILRRLARVDSFLSLYYYFFLLRFQAELSVASTLLPCINAFLGSCFFLVTLIFVAQIFFPLFLLLPFFLCPFCRCSAGVVTPARHRIMITPLCGAACALKTASLVFFFFCSSSFFESFTANPVSQERGNPWSLSHRRNGWVCSMPPWDVMLSRLSTTILRRSAPRVAASYII